MVGRTIARAVAVALLAASLGGCFVIPCPDDEDDSLLAAFIRYFGMCEPILPAAKGNIDLEPYYIVYVEVLPESIGGPGLADSMVAFRDEAVALTQADPVLQQLGENLAETWSARTRFFVNGLGIEAQVTQEMIDAMDGWLDRLASTGSPQLAAALAAERAARPPLQSLVGVNMNAFRAAVLPPDGVFRDEFE